MRVLNYGCYMYERYALFKYKKTLNRFIISNLHFGPIAYLLRLKVFWFIELNYAPTLVRGHGYFIPTKCHENPCNGCGEVENVMTNEA